MYPIQFKKSLISFPFILFAFVLLQWLWRTLLQCDWGESVEPPSKLYLRIDVYFTIIYRLKNGYYCPVILLWKETTHYFPKERISAFLYFFSKLSGQYIRPVWNLFKYLAPWRLFAFKRLLLLLLAFRGKKKKRRVSNIKKLWVSPSIHIMATRLRNTG